MLSRVLWFRQLLGRRLRRHNEDLSAACSGLALADEMHEAGRGVARGELNGSLHNPEAGGFPRASIIGSASE
jgi:hypothetical protein